VFSADANFDWGNLLQAGASLSLFAQRRLLELRLPSGKPGDKGAAALIEYCANPAEDTLLLISLPKLDGSAQKTKWGKALIEGGHCQFIQIWPVDAQHCRRINQRLSQAGLSAQRDAVDMIAARVEGNLLAAAQKSKAQAVGRWQPDHRRDRAGGGCRQRPFRCVRPGRCHPQRRGRPCPAHARGAARRRCRAAGDPLGPGP
jgi:hypothetical protein